MKMKKFTKHLTLNKKTIADLSALTMKHINAGYIEEDSDVPTCQYSDDGHTCPNVCDQELEFAQE